MYRSQVAAECAWRRMGPAPPSQGWVQVPAMPVGGCARDTTNNRVRNNNKRDVEMSQSGRTNALVSVQTHHPSPVADVDPTASTSSATAVARQHLVLHLQCVAPLAAPPARAMAATVISSLRQTRGGRTCLYCGESVKAGWHTREAQWGVVECWLSL